MKKNSKTNGHTTIDMIDADRDLDEATIDVAAATLTGDLRDFILDRLRHEQNKRAWHERSEAEQRDTVHQVETAVRHAVTQAIEIIAAGGLRTIKASIEQITVKDGIKATLTMSKFDENRHNLIDATGKTVLIVVADPEDFTGERAEVQITPDQMEILKNVTVVHSDGSEVPFNA